MSASCHQLGAGIHGSQVAGSVLMQRQTSADAEREVLGRLALATRGRRKEAAAHTRQHYEHQLAGVVGMRVRDLAHALATLPQEQRAWVLAPLLQAEQIHAVLGPVLVETEQVVTAAAALNAEVVQSLADGHVAAEEQQRIAAQAVRVVREAAEVAAVTEAGQ